MALQIPSVFPGKPTTQVLQKQSNTPSKAKNCQQKSTNPAYVPRLTATIHQLPASFNCQQNSTNPGIKSQQFPTQTVASVSCVADRLKGWTGKN